MGLQFHGKNKVRPGGPNVALKRPDLRTVKHIEPDYIRATGMDRAKIWGTDIEMLTLAHLLKTPVLCYVTEQSFWHRYILVMSTEL